MYILYFICTYIYIYIYTTFFFAFLKAVPTPAVSQRRSVTQTTPWPTISKNSSSLRTRSIRLLYTVHESDGKVAPSTNNPRRP